MDEWQAIRTKYHKDWCTTEKNIRNGSLPYNNSLSIPISAMLPTTKSGFDGDYCEVISQNRFCIGRLIDKIQRETGSWYVIYLFVSCRYDNWVHNSKIQPLGYTNNIDPKLFTDIVPCESVIMFMGTSNNVHDIQDNEKVIDFWETQKLQHPMPKIHECCQEKMFLPGELCETYYKGKMYLARIITKKFMEEKSNICYKMITIAQLKSDDIYFNWWHNIRPVGFSNSIFVKFEKLKFLAFEHCNHTLNIREQIHSQSPEQLLSQSKNNDICKKLFLRDWLSILVCDLIPNDYCEAQLQNGKFYWAKFVIKLDNTFVVIINKTHNLSYFIGVSVIRAFGSQKWGEFALEDSIGIEII